MSASAIRLQGQPLRRIITEPLGFPQFFGVTAAIVAIAVVYCQIYCAIAFQPMRGAAMPWAASIVWAISATVPWLICLELSKRRMEWGSSAIVQFVTVALLILTATSLSIILELGLDRLTSAHPTRPLSMQIATQLPAAILTASVIALGRLVGDYSSQGIDAAGEHAAELLARAASIEWIKGAGNYVEVHSRGRVSLHRVTMRELEDRLDAGQFRRIHKSVIVKIGAIDSKVSIQGSPGVRLVDGTILKVGGRYRTNLA